MKLSLFFSKSAIALFIVTAALVSCKKERNEPATEKKDLSAQARLSSLAVNRPIRMSANEIFVKVVDRNYVNDPKQGHARIYLRCLLNNVGGQETIKEIKVQHYNSGIYFTATAAIPKILRDRTRATVGYASVITAFTSHSAGFTIDPLDPDNIIFNINKTNDGYSGFTATRNGMQQHSRDDLVYFEAGKCAFSRDRNGKIQFSVIY